MDCTNRLETEETGIFTTMTHKGPRAVARTLSIAVKVGLLLAAGVATVHGSDPDPDDDCRLWIAPSYLSTDSRVVFGMYAGSQGFSKDDIIPSYEIAIPVFDFLQSPAASKSPQNRAIVDSLENDMWLSDYAGAKFEANSSTSAFIAGVGALPRYHAGVSNVDWVQGSLLLREPDEFLQAITGKPHASRGAITSYYNATVRATREIRPGMELFAQYGDNWDSSGNEGGVYHDKVLRGDYEKADQLLDKILEFMNAHGDGMSDKLKDEVLDFMLDTVLEGAAGKHAKVIRSLIPSHPAKLQRVKDAGGTFSYRNRDIVKTMDWLRVHGQCVDNLRMGKSTIDDAGRGAFAKRDMEGGTVISPVPMIPILNEEVLELYSETTAVVVADNIKKSDAVKDYVLDDTKPPTGHHLLLNYCFGHPESSLMLLPTAPMVNLINHAPTPSSVNAVLRWSKHDSVANDHDLHDLSLSDWNRHKTRPIVLELVATRDIQEGEEILISYGAGWAEAWQTYKEGFVALTLGKGFTKWPLKALDMRYMYKDKPFPTQISHGQLPYPQGVVTACFLETVDDLPDGQPRKNAAGQQLLQWLGPLKFLDFAGQNLVICDVIDRQEIVSNDSSKPVSYNYTVLTRLKDMSADKLLEVRNIPHNAITLVDRPYTSDVHLVGAFRRWINFDDQKFPQAWRNVRE